MIEKKTEEIHILDFLALFFRKKWHILAWSFLFALLFYGLSFFLPRWYQARTTVMPPAGETGSALIQFYAQMPFATGLPAPGMQKSKLFLDMLRSRTIGERLIEKFGLLQKWQEGSLEKTLRRLRSQTDLMATRDGLIVLQVKARKPNLAAELANAYIQELDALNREKLVSRAHSARLYIESQLDSTRRELSAASEKLAAFQKSHKAISLPDQIKEAIDQASQLKAKIMARNVALTVAGKTMKPNNPKIQALRTEIAALQKQYEEIQFGGDKPLKERKEFFVAFAEAPEVGLQLAALTRRVKILETVYQLLNQQYYRTKIEEAKDTPTVQVLDVAKPPERKCCPSRALIGATGGFLAFWVLIFWIGFQKYFEELRLRNPEEYGRWEKLKHALVVRKEPK